MQLFENIGMALTSVRSNKMRSLLTMLGIIIGIAAVIAIETVGNRHDRLGHGLYVRHGCQ